MKKIYESAKEILSEKYNREDLEKEAQRLSKVHNVPYDVVKHVINKETGGTWKTDQVNPDSGATGIMQILPRYATNTPAGYEVHKKDLLDPYKSMNAGIKKLGQWYNAHRNKKLPEDQLDVAAAKKAMASYNAGPNGGIEKDKQGKVKYVGAATYIKTGNPKHLPLEAQNYIKDFGVENKVASNKSDKPFKRDASAIKAQIDPKQHEIKDNRPQANTVAAPVVQSKPAQEAPKKEVKVNTQQQAAPEVKTQVSDPNSDNPYPPGSKDWYFKDARNRGLKSYKDPNTGKEIAVKLKEDSAMKNVYGVIKDILSEAKKERITAQLPSKEEQQRISKELSTSIRKSSANPTYGVAPLSGGNYERTPETVIKHKIAADKSWGGKEFSYNQYVSTGKPVETQQNVAAVTKAAKQTSNNAGDIRHTLSANTLSRMLPDGNNQVIATSIVPKTVVSQANNNTKQVLSKAVSQANNVVQAKAVSKANTVVAQANTAPQQKSPSVKKELTPFEKEFARARAAKETEFTWHDEKGRPYKVGTKLKGETSPPEVKKSGPVRTTTTRTRSVTPSATISPNTSAPSSSEKPVDTKSVEIPPEEMSSIDTEIANQKAAKKAEVDAKIKADFENMSMEFIGDKEDQNVNSNPEKENQPEKKRKFDYSKGLLGQDNSKTNEETQMSINKKFNVSDSLYTAVMEVMKKPSQGSAPRNEKEKDLAAMTPPGHLITHGDVLKARGVKMKEDTNVVGESLANTIVTLGKTVGLFRDEPESTSTHASKKDEKESIKQTNQGKANMPPPSKKAVKEGVMDTVKSVKDKLVKIGQDAAEPFTGTPIGPSASLLSTITDKRWPERKPGDFGYPEGKPDWTKHIVGDEKSTSKVPQKTPSKPIQKESMDTPGNSYEHQCAIHVKSESFGEGRTITTQHADPDQNGNIAWYDVMFEHGIERYVPTAELEILVSESHMHSMKKKKK
jgi:hypothetical protein